MNDIRKEERRLYAESQLLKSLAKDELKSLKRNKRKYKTAEIFNQRKQIENKRLFFHNYLLANEKLNKED